MMDCLHETLTTLSHRPACSFNNNQNRHEGNVFGKSNGNGKSEMKNDSQDWSAFA
jgi:hypothetical protein